MSEPLHREPTRRITPFAWAVAVCVLLAAAAVAAWRLLSPSPANVLATSPAFQDIQSSVSTTGRVVPEHEFIARADVPGPLESIDVHLGQEVHPGQLLVRMKDPYAATRVATANAALQTTEVINENMHQGGTQEERMSLRNDLERAQAESAASRSSLDMFLKLQQTGAASDAEVNAARHRVEVADQTMQLVQGRNMQRFSPKDVSSWTAKVSEARSNLASARASLANINITSPIAGTVYLLPITANDFVGVGAELVRVADLQKLEVHANFDEADMGKLHEGAPVQIQWEGKPGRIWHGVIKHAPLAAVMSGVRSVGESIITVTDVRNDLPPNTIVSVKVVFEQRQHVLSLPREALKTEGTANFVYKVVGDKLVRTPVDVGLMNLESFEVRGGLTASDRVALHALDDRPFVNGMQVQVRP